MTMAKKVNGYMINRGGWIEFDQAPDENGPWVPCTMVISNKAHERVFTESEVRELRQADRRVIQRMVDHINNARNSGDAPYNSINDIALWQALSTAEAHGFTPTKP
jgi:hypothetical protein